MVALPLAQGRVFHADLLSPSSPCRDALTIPEDKNVIAFLYFRNYYRRLTGDGHSRSLYLNSVTFFDLGIESFNVPAWTEVDRYCFFICLDHQVNAIIHTFHRCNPIH